MTTISRKVDRNLLNVVRASVPDVISHGCRVPSGGHTAHKLINNPSGVTMKKILKPSLAAVALALLAGTASAGIKDTPHNLTSSSTGPNKQSTTEQICVFCHTPHAAAAGTEKPPLWNKSIPSNAGYTTYSTANSSTIDGQVLAVGSVSAACLSCHDGTQAMDNIINAPGSGGYAAGGGGATGLAYNWGASTRVDGDGKLINSGAFIANLGQDLTNDHPIGIQYCGGGLSGASTTVSGTCKDGDFKLPKTANVNGAQVFWVDTSNAAARSKTDIILYTRTFSAGSGPSVECASCHDPHVSTTDGAASDINFMRVTTAGSAICLACHTK